MKESIFWEEKERRLYKLYKGEIETREHIWKGCREWMEGGGSWEEAVGWMLGEEGLRKW